MVSKPSSQTIFAFRSLEFFLLTCLGVSDLSFPLSVWPSGVDYFSEFMGTVSVSNFESKVSQSHEVSNLPFYTPLNEQPSKNELAGSQYFNS